MSHLRLDSNDPPFHIRIQPCLEAFFPQLVQNLIVLRDAFNGIASDSPPSSTESPNANSSARLFSLRLFSLGLCLDPVKCSIPLRRKLDQLSDLKSCIHGILANLRLLYGISNCKIQCMPKAVGVQSMLLLSKFVWPHHSYSHSCWKHHHCIGHDIVRAGHSSAKEHL